MEQERGRKGEGIGKDDEGWGGLFDQQASPYRLAAFNTTPVGKFNLKDDSSMLERAKNSCQLLVQRLFAHPSEPTEFGRWGVMAGC